MIYAQSDSNKNHWLQLNSIYKMEMNMFLFLLFFEINILVQLRCIIVKNIAAEDFSIACTFSCG